MFAGLAPLRWVVAALALAGLAAAGGVGYGIGKKQGYLEGLTGATCEPRRNHEAREVPTGP